MERDAEHVFLHMTSKSLVQSLLPSIYAQAAGMLMEPMPTKRISINTSFHSLLTWRNQVKLEVFTGSSGGVAVTDNLGHCLFLGSCLLLLGLVPILAPCHSSHFHSRQHFMHISENLLCKRICKYAPLSHAWEF